MKTRAFCVTLLAGYATGSALAQFNSGSDGSDGAFNPAASAVVDLAQAASLCDCDGGGTLDDPCRWDCPSPVPGNGVYDAEQWAVVFKYSTITIPAGVTVTFANHPSGAPVAWLATGLVEVTGTVSVNGGAGIPDTGSLHSYSVPGPGGFEGGVRGTLAGPASAGFGPGGGQRASGGTCGQGAGGGGSFTSGGGNGGEACTGGSGLTGATYGTARLLPLLGGSGGGGGHYCCQNNASSGGGAGAGAILIASSTDILHNGSVQAIGGAGGSVSSCNQCRGGGGGSGGAIRLIANNVSGNGGLSARFGNGNCCGGNGGYGYIRVEAAQETLASRGDPTLASVREMGPVFPPPTKQPILRILTVDGKPVPADPVTGNTTIETSLDNENLDPVTIEIEAEHVPPSTAVIVFVIPARGSRTELAVPDRLTLNGTCERSTASGPVTVPAGRVEIQLRASWVAASACP